MRLFGVPSRKLATLAVALAVAVSGCAAVQSKPDTEIVKERAQARVSAVVGGEFSKAYGYISPAGRSAMTVEDYISTMRRGFWKSATVEKVECITPEVCEVQLAIEYEARGARTRTPLKEKWIKDGPNWWYVLQ
jgi:hypothetical protein